MPISASLILAFTYALAPMSGHLAPAGAPPDSAHIVRSARSAQASFEAFRRTHVPRGVGHGGGPCDLEIGRYCYWRGDEDEDDDDPPAEPKVIQERRNALLDLLDSASDLLPGDAWLAGQRVRYLVEADRTDDAIGFVSRCQAGAAWCAALGGYALHVAGRYAAADSAYEHALALMDEPERCRWFDDVSRLLDDRLLAMFAQGDCGRREALVRRMFWLGAPLYSVSGTDLLTEHLARVTWVRMAENSAPADGEPWGDDSRELVLRYGWPRWYSQSDPPIGSDLIPSIVGHDAGMPYDFLPSPHALDHAAHATRDDWNLDDPFGTTAYTPSFARSIHALPGQIAVFRRGDSALVVAAWDAQYDRTMLGRKLDAALALVDVDHIRAIAHDTVAKVAGRISVTGLLDSGVVSLELLAREDRRATRLRIGLPPWTTDRVSLSDLLVYGAGADPPTELGAARDSALATTVVSGTRRLGVYWEAYGLNAGGEAVQYTLNVEEIGESWLRRAAERLHVTDPSSGLQLAWSELARPRDGIAGRGVRVDLSRLHSGRYRIELEARIAGESPVRSAREIEVR